MDFKNKGGTSDDNLYSQMMWMIIDESGRDGGGRREEIRLIYSLFSIILISLFSFPFLFPYFFFFLILKNFKRIYIK